MLKEICGDLVASLLVSSNFNYVGHKVYICNSIGVAWKEPKREEKYTLGIRNYKVEVKDKSFLYTKVRIGAWLTAVPHDLNCMELSQE